MHITKQELEKHFTQLRKLSNSAKYAKAYRLAKSLMKKHPHVLQFAYYEAVLTAEDVFNFAPKKVQFRYRLAAKKLRLLLKRTRGASLELRNNIKNEYYWFSKQPYKQYQLGLREEKLGAKRGGYYSQGVGAAQLAKHYGLSGKKVLALRWAKKSETAWAKFFKLDANWYNSYFFYAMAIGYQDRLKDCDKALRIAARTAKRPQNWNAILKLKKEIMQVHKAIYGDSNRTSN